MKRASLLIVLFVFIIAFAAPVQAGPGHFCENDDPDKEFECLNKYAPATPDYKQAYQPLYQSAYQPLHLDKSIDMTPAQKAPKKLDEPLQVFLEDYSSIKDPQAKLALLKQMRASAKEAVRKGQPKNISTWEAPLPLSYTILDADLDKNIIDEETLNEFKTFAAIECNLSGTYTFNDDVAVLGSPCYWYGNITINGTLSVTSSANLYIRSTSSVTTQVTVKGHDYSSTAVTIAGKVYIQPYLYSPYKHVYFYVGQDTYYGNNIKDIYVNSLGGLHTDTSSNARAYFYANAGYWGGIRIAAGGDIDFDGGNATTPGTRLYSVYYYDSAIHYQGGSSTNSSLFSVKGTYLASGQTGIEIEDPSYTTLKYFDSNITVENNLTPSTNSAAFVKIYNIKVDEAIKIRYNTMSYNNTTYPIRIHSVETAQEIDLYANDIDVPSNDADGGIDIQDVTYGSGKGIWVGHNTIDRGETGIKIVTFSVNDAGGWCGGPNVYGNTLTNNVKYGIYIDNMQNSSRCTEKNYFSVHGNTISHSSSPTTGTWYAAIYVKNVTGWSDESQNVWYNTVSDFPQSIFLDNVDYFDVESNNLSYDGTSTANLLFNYYSDYTTIGGSTSYTNNFGAVSSGYQIKGMGGSATCSYNHFDSPKACSGITCTYDQP